MARCGGLASVNSLGRRKPSCFTSRGCGMRRDVNSSLVIHFDNSQKKERSMRKSTILCLFALFLSFFLAPRAMAVPSYARQTGLSCNGCHYTPPELNPAGRLFKLYGYIDKMKTGGITAEQDKRHSGLDLLTT